ncbi:MAG TPA: hypothetical protein PLA50_05825 [Bacteroidia bacterium]|nr:hypothetical protein [Bacteroidia bacterium]
MSLPRDLLAQARHLAKKEPRRPLQASLRRAVSTAYYALFHFLGEESSRLLIGAAHHEKSLRDLARRAIAHTRLKDVCLEFQKATPKALLKPHWRTSGVGGDADLAVICANFVELQQARQTADYDFTSAMNRSEALDACDKVQEAIAAWERLKARQPEALKLFALSILLWPGLASR